MASIRPDGTELAMLGVGHDPTISPDGKSIGYTGHPPEGGVTVYVMDYDGKNNRRVVHGSSAVGATFPNWSPDSSQLVYSFPVGDALELFIIRADGTGERQLTSFGVGSVCTPAAWSPDGKWISFRRTDERYWSDPERMKLVYDIKPADKRPVWVIRPDGTCTTLIEPLQVVMFWPPTMIWTVPALSATNSSVTSPLASVRPYTYSSTPFIRQTRAPATGLPPALTSTSTLLLPLGMLDGWLTTVEASAQVWMIISGSPRKL